MSKTSAPRHGPAFARIAAGALRIARSGDMLERLEAQRRDLLAKDALAARTAWRDRRRMALAAQPRRQASTETAD